MEDSDGIAVVACALCDDDVMRVWITQRYLHTGVWRQRKREGFDRSVGPRTPSLSIIAITVLHRLERYGVLIMWQVMLNDGQHWYPYLCIQLPFCVRRLVTRWR